MCSPPPEGLYHYLLATEADLDDCLIVELDGEPAEDLDFDADQGAVLVIPSQVIRCDAVDRELVERISHQPVPPS